jgi:hypothetical protein
VSTSPEYKRERLKKLRFKALELYGNKCVSCGESQNEFLAFDHINSVGYGYRRSDSTFYLSILKEKDESVQLLCHNCNWIKYINSRPTGTTESSKSYRNLKFSIIEHYSPEKVCMCCGYNNIIALTINHIKGGGNDEVQRFGGRYRLLMSIRDRNYPPEYNILCYNCNFSLGRYGYCPHKKIQNVGL